MGRRDIQMEKRDAKGNKREREGHLRGGRDINMEGGTWRGRRKE